MTVRKKLLIYGDEQLLGDVFKEALDDSFDVTFVFGEREEEAFSCERICDVVLILTHHSFSQEKFASFLPASLFVIFTASTSDISLPPFVTRLHMPCVINELIHLLNTPTKETRVFGGGFFLESYKLLIEKKTNKIESITEKETQIISYLYKKRGETVSKDELLTAVWGYHPDITTHTLETHVYRLRKKLSQVGMEGLLHFEGSGYVLDISSDHSL